jgi:hypothetical protein
VSGFAFYHVFNDVTTYKAFGRLGAQPALLCGMNFSASTRCIWPALILGLFGLGLASNGRAQSQDVGLSTDPPLIKVDLNSYGDPPSRVGGREKWSLAFVGGGKIVLGWTTLDDADAAKKRGYLIPAPSHLHAVILDTSTGEKSKAHDWSVSTLQASIRPVANGDFLLYTGGAVRLLSQNFDLIREQILPNQSPGPIIEDVSPTGNYFSIEGETNKKWHHTVMKTETFAQVATWTDEARGVRFSDVALVGNCVPKGELCLRTFDTPWVKFAFPDGTGTAALCFLTDSRLALKTRDGLAVVTTDRNTFFRLSLGSKQSFVGGACSAGGQRVAVVQTTMRGVTNERLDMYAFPSDDEAVVFGVFEEKAIYRRKLKGTSPWWPFTSHRNSLAISADGTLLAILDDGVLSVYQLPVPRSR